MNKWLKASSASILQRKQYMTWEQSLSVNLDSTLDEVKHVVCLLDASKGLYHEARLIGCQAIFGQNAGFHGTV